MPDELFPPDDLRRALHSQFREVRLGAIGELSGTEWLHHQDPVRASAARRQLEYRAGVEDDQTVKAAIHGHLGGHLVQGRQAPPRATPGRRRRDTSLVGIGVICGAGVATLVIGALTAAHGPDRPPEPRPSPSPSKPAHVKPVRHVGPPPASPSGQPLAASPDGQGVHAVAFSPAGDLLATGESTGASSGMTYLWNVASRQVAARLPDTSTQGPAYTLGVTAVAYNRDGTVVASADQNGYVYVWNSVGQPVFAPLHDSGSYNGARSVAFSPDGQYIASGDGNGDVYLWSAASGTCLAYARDPGDQHSVSAVAFSPDSAVLATGDAGGGTYLWDTAALATASPAETGCQGNPAALQPAALPVPDGQKVTAVAFSPDGQDIATGDADGNTYIWNASSRQIAHTVTDQGSTGVSSVAFSENSAVLATGDADGKAYLWYAATGDGIHVFPHPGGDGGQDDTGVDAVAFSPGSAVGTLAVGDADGSTYLWPMAWLGY
jgi:WD40 repeat protein